METLFNDGMSQIVIRLFFAWLGHLQTTNETAAAIMADDLRMFLLNRAQTGAHNHSHQSCVAGEVGGQDLAQTGQRCGAANRIACVRAGHRAGWELVHNFLSANDSRQRQRTADALAAADYVWGHAVMLEGPELTGAPESSLNFVTNEQHIMGFAPIGQFADVIIRRKVRPDPLVRFEHYPRHIF